MKHQCGILLLLFLLVPLRVIAESANGAAFSADQLEKLKNAPWVSVSLIMDAAERKRVALAPTPISTPDSCPFCPSLHHCQEMPQETTHYLSKEEILKIVGYLEKAPLLSIADRLKTCTFQPGIKFSFHEFSPGMPGHTDAPFLTILLCLNCDLWAVPTESGKDQQKVVRYADSRPFRSELLDIKGKLLQLKTFAKVSR